MHKGVVLRTAPHYSGFEALDHFSGGNQSTSFRQKLHRIKGWLYSQVLIRDKGSLLDELNDQGGIIESVHRLAMMTGGTQRESQEMLTGKAAFAQHFSWGNV
jgi:hypothetical protein